MMTALIFVWTAAVLNLIAASVQSGAGWRLVNIAFGITGIAVAAHLHGWVSLP